MTDYAEAKRDIARSLAMGNSACELFLSEKNVEEISAWLAGEGIGKLPPTDASAIVVGTRIHGYANGVFGRDSYECRTVEAVGADWIVTRNKSGITEMVTREEASRIEDIDNRFDCGEWCDFD